MSVSQSVSRLQRRQKTTTTTTTRAKLIIIAPFGGSTTRAAAAAVTAGSRRPRELQSKHVPSSPANLVYSPINYLLYNS